MAAGPPASKPRKNPALFAVLFPFSDAYRAPHLPNTADEIHCDKTGGEVLDEVPAAMELL